MLDFFLIFLALISFHRLILSPMHAWKLFVDIVLLQCDGNVIDAAGLGVSGVLSFFLE